MFLLPRSCSNCTQAPRPLLSHPQQLIPRAVPSLQGWQHPVPPLRGTRRPSRARRPATSQPPTRTVSSNTARRRGALPGRAGGQSVPQQPSLRRTQREPLQRAAREGLGSFPAPQGWRKQPALVLVPRSRRRHVTRSTLDPLRQLLPEEQRPRRGC